MSEFTRQAEHVGIVAELRRYPVKSMEGESLERAVIDTLGLLGDRWFAARDADTGALLAARQVPALLRCSARLLAEPTSGDRYLGRCPVELRLPGGQRVRDRDADVDAALSAALDRAVRLAPIRGEAEPRPRAPRATGAELREAFALAPGEAPPDLSRLPLRLLAELAAHGGPRGAFVDAYPLHVLTTASLDALAAVAGGRPDARRFRPNLLIESPAGTGGFAEFAWCGGLLRCGSLVLRLEVPTVRCAAPIRPQCGLPAAPELLRAVAEHAGRCLGIYATVLRSGEIRVGDPVTLERPSPSRWRQWTETGATTLKRWLLRAAMRA